MTDQKKRSEWEENNWYQFFRERLNERDNRDLKSFISSLLSQVRKKERERVIKKIEKVGLYKVTTIANKEGLHIDLGIWKMLKATIKEGNKDGK